MLQIEIPDTELFDENSQTFSTIKGRVLNLEHSLISLAKWESRWNKPFLVEFSPDKEDLSQEKVIDYIRCMTIDKSVDDAIYNAITPTIFDQVVDYINLPMTATWFKEDKNNGMSRIGRDIVTAEILYSAMIELKIPFECQKWHLNRLVTLIRVRSIREEEAANPKKLKKGEILSRNRSLNEARRKKLGSRG